MIGIIEKIYLKFYTKVGTFLQMPMIAQGLLVNKGVRVSLQASQRGPGRNLNTF